MLDDTTVTVLGALGAALRAAAAYNKHDQAAPVAVLWPDKDRHWEPLIPRLREALAVLTLGPYDPATRTGPAIWIRCMVERALPEADWPADAVPVVYLPGVSKQELRAVEECPRLLQPLAELQYRGVLFTHKNGRDWTIPGFIQAPDAGIGAAVAEDTATKDAARNALLKLADTTVDALRAQAPLNAAFFNDLLNPDPVLQLLRWMDAPEAQRTAATPEEWAAFRATCQSQFGLDPDKDGALTAAQRLGDGEGSWSVVWSRFAEAPTKYKGLPDLLRAAKPAKPDSLFYNRECWPQETEQAEAELRDELNGLAVKTGPQAAAAIQALESHHAVRRQWVWHILGLSPLAGAMPALARMAQAVQTPLAGSTPTAIAEAYAAGGWRADAAMLECLGAVSAAEDATAVKGVVRALYAPWLLAAAAAFQNAVKSAPLPTAHPAAAPGQPKPGRCILFADGLRLDTAKLLEQELVSHGVDVTAKWQFGAQPGVTDTGKPAVSPVAGAIRAGEGLGTKVASDDVKVTADILRRELAAAGWQVLAEDEAGDPNGSAWTECGRLDSCGHAEGWRLAMRLGEVIDELVERIRFLLKAGWSEVRVVTDHGWLLLPSGLPKAELAEHLTEVMKGRCARLKPVTAPPHQSAPWYWDPAVTVSAAPGISCYTAGKEYEHGGLSPQECVLPVLTVRQPDALKQPAAVSEAKWVGLRCRILATGDSKGVSAALRTKPADPATSLSGQPVPLDANGKAGLLVEDDSAEGSAAVIVLLGPSGQVISQKSTIVGEDG
jgi:hypothetical protein